MTHTEVTMSTSQETSFENPSVQKKPFKRIEIKSDGKGPKRYYHDPVCDYCKAKKILCHHRAIYDEFGNLVKPAEEPPKLDGPKPTSVQVRRVVEKAGKNDTAKQSETTGKETEKPSETKTASQRPRRANAGKRKLDDTSNENAATNDSKRQKPERKKPGRKPRQKTPIPTIPIVIEDIEAESPSVSSPVTEPSTTPVVTQRLCGGNLDNSMDMAWHRGMTTLLEQHIYDTAQKWETLNKTIKEAEKQWEEVRQSMQTTKDHMNEWTSRWTMSDAFTL